MALCPCGTSLAFDHCCGRYLSGQASAPTAEALMRSRYTAYVLRDESYLLASWHPSTRPAALEVTREAPVKWVGLELKRVESSGPDTGVVEFVARYKVNGRAQRMHEISRFVREDGRWLYVDGESGS